MASEIVTVERGKFKIPSWLQGLFSLLLAGGALALLVAGWYHTSSPLVVEVDGHRREARSHVTTVGAALSSLGYDLYPEDYVEPGLEEPLHAGMHITVRRAQPVILSADGKTRQFRTRAMTVGAFLSEVGVAVGPADEIWLGDRLVEIDTALISATQSKHQEGTGGGARPPQESQLRSPPQIRLHRAASITLIDERVLTTLHTTLPTVGGVLQEHGVQLFLGDEVSPDLQSKVIPDMTVAIARSVPVTIDVDGRQIHTRTRAETVAGVLGNEGVALLGKDRVEPDLVDPVRSDMTVRVTRVREEFAVEFEPIPFETVWVPDPEVEIDNIKLAEKGQIGLTKRRHRVTYENGVEVGRILEDSWFAQPPVNKTMAYGTKIVIRTLDTPDGVIEYWRKMRVYTTSYRPASTGRPKDHPRYGRTRLGWVLRKGIVAVDPTVIPLKTFMYVPGYGIAQAGDTGGGVKGKFVDLGFRDNEYESWHWWSDIYIMTPVPPRDRILWVLPDWPKYPDRSRR